MYTKKFYTIAEVNNLVNVLASMENRKKLLGDEEDYICKLAGTKIENRIEELKEEFAIIAKQMTEEECDKLMYYACFPNDKDGNYKIYIK